jgi:hypothetical protein
VNHSTGTQTNPTLASYVKMYKKEMTHDSFDSGGPAVRMTRVELPPGQRGQFYGEMDYDLWRAYYKQLSTLPLSLAWKKEERKK